MRGRKYIKKRKIVPDPIYRDTQCAKFINYLLQRGKKTIAQKIFYKTLDIVKQKTNRDPKEVFFEALDRVGPSVEVRPRRVGGANYQIPFPVEGYRKFYLASHWLIGAASSKKGRPMEEKLAQEILLALEGQGEAIKKRDTVQKMAEANKAFAHFAQMTR
ncbi:MAG: 30S ribosomal protein S7 [Parcubacteria group bacterium]|nr:30S ribosomal protein S7 [Parcubacteria group bacterium]